MPTSPPHPREPGDGAKDRIHAPEVLATQRLEALSQGTVQAGLRPLPRRLDEGGEEPPE